MRLQVISWCCFSHAFEAWNGSFSWHIHSGSNFAIAKFSLHPHQKGLCKSMVLIQRCINKRQLTIFVPQLPHSMCWAHCAGWSPWSLIAMQCLVCWLSQVDPNVFPFFPMISCLVTLRDAWKALFSFQKFCHWPVSVLSSNFVFFPSFEIPSLSQPPCLLFLLITFPPLSCCFGACAVVPGVNGNAGQVDCQIFKFRNAVI